MVDAGALDFIHERDMATHRMGFAVIALGLLSFIVAAKLWHTGRRPTAVALGVVGLIASMTGCAYTGMRTMV